MSTERVKCIECENMILPQTAAANGGLCAPCAKLTPSARQKLREFEHQLATGAVFRPGQEELDSATQPEEFCLSDPSWELEPNFYAGNELDTIEDVITRASNESEGNVFLVSNSGSRFNLSFTAQYGVCAYENEFVGTFLYAYSDWNLCHQVPAGDHVMQACPCCGEGTLWYPSRYHMPRAQAFEIVRSVMAAKIPQGVLWLDRGDISYISRGLG